MTSVRSLAQGSIVVGFAVLGLKYVAYQLTGSVALLSDAIESIVNVVTAIVALLAVSLSAKPADEEHPYGHHKAEYFSAVLEGVLIVLAAILILREAWFSYLAPRPLEAPWLGLAVNGLATVLNAGWAWALIHRGRQLKSPALAADGRHLVTDVVSSIGVLGGVGVAALSGIAVLDPILAALVALNILWAGWALMKESLSGLMDEAIPPTTLVTIKKIISTQSDGAIEAHDLRTRRAGRMTFIDFHLVVAGSTTVSAAHDICDHLEVAIRQEIGEALITIHVEPDDKAKHSGIVVL
ncbi:cation diffusion facilitator family transporter [Tardiphaga sp.]|jgi:cation diffusion facilitator family transporter|uniref:cation diffusion facilitator family transporter n=1 Tax=Tardiphaga sp. TaxID=1926292 RepID=UPI0025E5490E|nr:cation diffusion facilitator family transporter [Tardiphaga sp.]